MHFVWGGPRVYLVQVHQVLGRGLQVLGMALVMMLAALKNEANLKLLHRLADHPLLQVDHVRLADHLVLQVDHVCCSTRGR